MYNSTGNLVTFGHFISGMLSSALAFSTVYLQYIWSGYYNTNFYYSTNFAANIIGH